ncbi:5-oxoprolinase subunit PxpB [Saccharothrix algeriensis]|uniref:5-oxoprolinase subunit PxpB n=1 Tax=Saccharothrix algeriensis TaxID=173560 RepID=A0A8T8HRJ9_9PSEU|nr:5-oxoprolinase subunit PxpB [Saccharothrix algeriensis]MBM7812457.1 KipI family sensor histidine kinase inhibitor [Saccharothrix algeriensis]QTR01202.1 5-oxoprolinase subunit PxpB [Saccharothrix algeriensis]
MRLRRCGTDAVLVEVDSLGEVEAVRAAVRAAALPEVVEVVPAARTVLVATRPGGLPAVLGVLEDVDPAHRAGVPSHEVVLPVVYDGPDLELVARTAGLTADEVVRLHSGATYSVAFCGFAPGFAYLAGLPGPLRQPRLDSPRTSVPAGSVGVAGEYTAAYPRSTPGGWRLIGRTDAPLFDPARDAPALLAPGDRVRFEAVG